MSKRLLLTVAALTAAMALAALSSAIPVRAADSSMDGHWNPRAAAAYLDGRATWWATWPTAARDHDTFCVSCHTMLPYALARPRLRAQLGEHEPSPAESRLLDSVARRVAQWNEVAPYYPDQTRGVPKTSESRGTESILNALVLATRDRDGGRLADDTRAAFDHMWALQMRTGELSGGWIWLNFHNEPWESPSSPYFGAALAAIAIGTAPGGYAATPAIQDNLKLLRAYFQRGLEQQPLVNRLMLLWASGTMPDLISAEQRQAVVDTALSLQHDDGGWSAASLYPLTTRPDGTPEVTESDGYATGLATLALEASGLHTADERAARGRTWLERHQDPATGRWAASSLNKQRDPASDAGKFMTDAATGYAVLALVRPR